MEVSGQFLAPALLALLSELRNASDTRLDGPRVGLDVLDQRRVDVGVQAIKCLLNWINLLYFLNV
jgi:hypothetical protein